MTNLLSNGGDACPCHLTAATHARAVVAAAAGRILATAAGGHVLATARILAAHGHVLATARAAAARAAAAAAASLHADTAGIHILSRVGVTGGIVAIGHFYIQTYDFLYAFSQPFKRRKSSAFCLLPIAPPTKCP